MKATVSTDLLQLLCVATPEQEAAITRFARELVAGVAAPAVVKCVATAETGPRFVFRKAGSHWRVVYDGGGEFHLEDTLGVRYFDHLLHHPNLAISAFDLEVAIRPEKSAARTKDSIQVTLDPETIRQYLRDLVRLRAEREDAGDSGELARAERLDEEIEALEEAIRGKGGQSADAGERARSNVNKALALVRRRLGKGGKAEKDFGEHVERFVSVGYECMYSQPAGDCWE